jgi:hypothetical protein
MQVWVEQDWGGYFSYTGIHGYLVHYCATLCEKVVVCFDGSMAAREYRGRHGWRNSCYSVVDESVTVRCECGPSRLLKRYDDTKSLRQWRV